jgi:hypothetical protein
LIEYTFTYSVNIHVGNKSYIYFKLVTYKTHINEWVIVNLFNAK